MAQEGALLWKTVIEIADKVCKKYGLSYGKLLPETRKAVRFYGECRSCDRCCNSPVIDAKNCSDKILSIRIHQLKNPNKALATVTILRTLAHELAHLKVWRHGLDHAAFEKELVEFMKEEGYF